MKKITDKDVVVIHGFEDWTPTIHEWRYMMNTCLVGASQDCDATINGVRKTVKEWQQEK